MEPDTVELLCRGCGSTWHRRRQAGARPKRCPACTVPTKDAKRRPLNGVLVWEGPSLINGEPITVVITGIAKGSLNKKIGKMAQAWILPAEAPREAIPAGREASVCGSCVRRPALGGNCYVSWRWGPQMVWYARHQMGSYPALDEVGLDVLNGVDLRVGAYGDPAAVPLSVWLPILERVAGWTGYTHRWREIGPEWVPWFMASTDTVQEDAEARARGWRTFLVLPLDVDVPRTHVLCPAADKTRAKQATCAGCQLCAGHGRAGRLDHPAVRSVAIHEHGGRVGRRNPAVGDEGRDIRLALQCPG